MIIRVVHENHFTTIRNKTVRDSRLSYRARGLLFYLLSLPDDARVSREHLAEAGPDGVRAVRSALAELAEAGYLTREVLCEGRNRLRTVTTVRERPRVIGGAKRAADANRDGADTKRLQTAIGGALSTSTKRATLRSNKEGARPKRAGAPPPEKYLCAACARTATRMAMDETWWCDEHRAEYELRSLLPRA